MEHLKKKIIEVPSNLFQKIEEEASHPNSFYEVSITPPSLLSAFLSLPGGQGLAGLKRAHLPSLGTRWRSSCGLHPWLPGGRVLGAEDLPGFSATVGDILGSGQHWSWVKGISIPFYITLISNKNVLMSLSCILRRQIPPFPSQMCKTPEQIKQRLSPYLVAFVSIGSAFTSPNSLVFRGPA